MLMVEGLRLLELYRQGCDAGPCEVLSRIELKKVGTGLFKTYILMQDQLLLTASRITSPLNASVFKSRN